MNMKKRYIIFALLLMYVLVPALAQQRLTVSGTVSEQGGALPGVTVFVKNQTGIGTTTDINGKFSITAERGQVILFSFIGYQTVEYFVEREISDLQITMVETTAEIEEVVIAALGTTQRKITTVGALSTVDTKDLQVPATSLANILGGRMSGVITMQESGEPGKNISEFWIRGIGTFGANASALVLIDGLEGDLNSVDPADIESFSILKDASATAVYGVRGANGVVLITTKQGHEGKLKLSVRSNFTVAKLQRMPEYVRSYPYAQLRNEAFRVRGNTPFYLEGDMEIIRYGLDPDIFPDVDWQSEIMNPVSFQQTYYISAQGGSNVARYFLSLGTSNETAAYKVDPNGEFNAKTGYNTYSYRTNLNINLTPTTQVFFSADGYLTRKTQPGINNTDWLWFSLSQYTPVLVPLKYSTGHIPAYGVNDQISPYVLLNYTGTASENTNTFKSTISLNQDLSIILSGLTLRIQGAFDSKTYFNERRYVLPDLYRASGRTVDGELQLTRRVNQVNAQYNFSQRQYRRYHLESTLNYEKIFADVHRFSALVYYYMSDSKDTNDITGSNINSSMAAIPKRYQGISSRFTYGYRDTYLLDFNFGYTGSENFQKGRRYGFFPSIALGWVPTQYDWTKNNLTWLDFFKIRASYGTVGNDKISNSRFPYLTMVNTGVNTGWGYDENGLSESSIGADNLMWERAIKSNIGIDVRLLKDAVNFTIDFFSDQRDGIFQRRANIPGYVGLLQMPFGNVGKMISYGSDGNISYRHELNKDMNFTIRANYTYSINKVQNWEQASQPYDYLEYTGYPYNAVRGLVSMGLFRDEQDVKSSPRQTWSSEVLPGDIRYMDVNGDGIINNDDRVVLSYPTYPRLMYGFGGEFQWKRFTIGCLFKGTGNNDYYHVGQTVSQFGSSYINGMGYVPFHGDELGTVLSIAADPRNRWIPMDYALANGIDPALAENPDARFPRLDHEYNANNSQLSDFWKGNKKYLRFQEATINYNWRAEFFRKVNISAVDLQLVGSNLYVWDSVNIFDPEQAQFNGRAYPIPLRVTFQIYVHF